MRLNKYSSAEEVQAYYEAMPPSVAMRRHLDKFYPMWMDICGPSQDQLEKAIRTLSTKAMETL